MRSEEEIKNKLDWLLKKDVSEQDIFNDEYIIALLWVLEKNLQEYMKEMEKRDFIIPEEEKE